MTNPMSMFLPLRAAIVSAVLLSCAKAPEADPSGGGSTTAAANPSVPPPAHAPPAPEAAPWSGASLAAADVPAVYQDVWRAADNRQRCRLLAPHRLPAADARATPRAATFSGGWAVAYDAADQRSAFGVAGTATDPGDKGIYDRWPYRVTWADSSSAEYGLEGGSGPNWLAYVRVRGQECLYNVWSRRGKEHLEELLGHLRFVSG